MIGRMIAWVELGFVKVRKVFVVGYKKALQQDKILFLSTVNMVVCKNRANLFKIPLFIYI
jgi:hypothetical protein